MLTAKLVGRGSRHFSPHIFLLIAVSAAETQQPFPLLHNVCYPAVVILLPLKAGPDHASRENPIGQSGR